jgi:hypothetical protein
VSASSVSEAMKRRSKEGGRERGGMGLVSEGMGSGMISRLNFHGQDFEFVAPGDLGYGRAADRAAHGLQVGKDLLDLTPRAVSGSVNHPNVQLGALQRAAIGSEIPGEQQGLGHQPRERTDLNGDSRHGLRVGWFLLLIAVVIHLRPRR